MRNFLFSVFTLLSILCKSQTQFGTLVSFPDLYHTSGNIIDVANQLGAQCIRQSVTMQGWDGTSTRFDQFVAAGLKVVLNVNWGNPAGSPIPFPTDTNYYKTQLSAILDIHHPEVVVIENEELTEQYHSGPIEDYINELTAAIGVCHSKGLKVANAGLLTTPLCIVVYNDFVKRGMTVEADDFKNRTFNPQMLSYISNPGNDSDLGVKVEKCNKLISAFGNLDLDYINFHLAEIVNSGNYGNGDSATPKVYQEIVDFLASATGKPAMTNETAQKNLSPSLVTSMLNEYNKTGIKYVIWYSGDGDNLVIPDSALHNTDGTLRLNGIAFSNFMANRIVDLSKKAALFASPLSSFDTLCINSTSAYKIFTLIGPSLNGSNVTIGPLAGFTFSTSDTGAYTPSLVISGYGKSFTEAVYVKFNPAKLGYYSGSIPIRGGGVISTSVAVNGTVINSSPVLSANVASISCYGNINDGAIDLTTSGGTGPFTYSWTSSDLTFYKSSDQNINNLKPANYTVEVTSQAGCKITARYLVIEPDKLDVIIKKDSNIICKDGSTTVSVAATGGTLPYNGTGVFTVNYGTSSYTINDARGCNKTESLFVANGTDDGPSKPGSITGADADSKGVCGNGNYVYSISTVTGATSYNWKAPSGITITSINASKTSATLSASSSFSSGSLTVSAKNACGISPAQAKIINETPDNPGSITGPATVSKNKVGLVYAVSPVVAGLTYTWTVNNGAKITAGQNTASITVNWGILAGKVTVKAQNSCGTSTGISKDISISKFLVANGGDSELASSDEMNRNLAQDLQIMPNPVKQAANIIFNAGNEYNYLIKITDLSGRVLQVKQGLAVKGQNRISIDVHNFTTGIYIITLENKGSWRKSVKLVKE